MKPIRSTRFWKRHAVWMVAAMGLSTTFIGVGCSVSGTWKTVSIEPRGIPFPVDSLTMDDEGQYTTTWTQNGLQRTNTGVYKWNGTKLTMTPRGFTPVTYRARLRLDGRLTISHHVGNTKATAVLERQDATSK